MFHFWINTSFIDNQYLCFTKEVIDGASSDKHNKSFEPEFKIELFLDLVCVFVSVCVRMFMCFLCNVHVLARACVCVCVLVCACVSVCV
jgi:hypothetical protein